MTGDRHTINALVMRWTGPARDAHAPAAQLRLERRLAAVDWQPPGLPPGAILLVRRLDGLPPLHDNGSFALEWEAQLHDRLAELLHTAARPHWGLVPLDAASILFESPAEMLACLMREVLANGAGHSLPWYWAQVAASGTADTPARAPWSSAHAGWAAPGARLAAVWARHAAFLPAALAHLALDERHRAAALLDEIEAGGVLDALCVAFALELPHLDASPVSKHIADERAGEPANSGTPRVAWSAWLPPLPDHIAPSACALLGWCAALRSAPALARSAAFARQVASWLARRHSISGEPRNVPDRRQVSGDQSRLENPALTDGGNFPAALAESDSIHRANQPEQVAAALPQTDGWKRDSRNQGAAYLAAIDLAADGPAILGTGPGGLVTEWGGVLFLVHLLSWLDWSESWESSLDAWELLEAIALALLGQGAFTAQRDSIWAALAVRDGRAPGDPLGMHCAPAADFRLSFAWLRRFAPAARWQIAGSDQMLRVWDVGRGFLVAEVALDGQPPALVARREVDAARAAGLEIAWTMVDAVPPLDAVPLASGRMTPALAEWMSRAVGFLRYVLGSVLGDPSLPLDTLANLILRQPGVLVTSDTHIDLTLPLNASDVRLRRAGLDHDPGWVPALGCIVLFHFVE